MAYKLSLLDSNSFHANVAYLSTWRPHGNWVSKTWFTTLINIEKNPEHIRENPEKKKIKIKIKPEEPRTQNRETQAVRGLDRARPGRRAAWVFFTQVTCNPGSRWPRLRDPSCVLPRSCVTQAARCPGRARPRPRAAWVFFTQVASYYLRLMVGN